MRTTMKAPGRRLRRRWPAAVGALALLATACGSDGDDSATDEPTTTVAFTGEDLVIGLVRDTSGPSAAVSTVSQVGIDLAVEEINAAGGIGGRQIVLVPENDGGDATQTPALVRRLAEEGAEAILFTTGSASASAAKPLCTDLQVVCLHPTSPSAALATPPDNEYFFTLPPGIPSQIEVFAEAFETTGVESIGVIEDDTPTIQPIQDVLIGGLEEAGIEVTDREVVPAGTTDASAAVARVGDGDPDAILVGSLDGRTEITIYNAIQQQLPDMPRFGRQATPNQPDTWVNANPGALDGVVFSQTIDSTNPRTEELITKLEDRLGEDFVAMSDYYAQAYDAMYLLDEAFVAADGGDLLAAMEAISGYEPHFGRDGFTLSFAPDKHIAPDSACGIVLLTFGPDDRPAGPWEEFQAEC